MTHDRTDEIRVAVVQARQVGWAAQLDRAVELLRNPEDATLALAIVMEVQRSMAPMVRKADVEPEPSESPRQKGDRILRHGGIEIPSELWLLVPAIGSKWWWEPKLPHARSYVQVTNLRVKDDGEVMVESMALKGRNAGRPFWCDLSRWVEATVLDVPAPGEE